MFFTVIAGLTELFIAGMPPDKVLTARLITIPVMILTGRPYGIWRDWVLSHVDPKHRLAMLAADILAFLIFQVPIYVTTLFFSGAHWVEVKVAVGAAIFIMIALRRPFGIFLDMLRGWTGTRAA